MDIDCQTDDDAWCVLPDREALARQAVEAAFGALEEAAPDAELAVVFTGDAAMAELNRLWRGKSGPTNVLSFPAVAAANPDLPKALGDIVLAAGVVTAEADAQGKPLANHVQHLIIHGTLHLLGHDHDEDDAAQAMERLETRAMARLGLPDPYRIGDAAGRERAQMPAG